MTIPVSSEANLAEPPPLPKQDGFFGHPRGLATLFFTELWERFSYGGMRALLFLYMTAASTEGGLGFSVAAAGSITGTYGALLYVGAVLGGWLSDRLLGPRLAVLYGGLVIMLGHICLSREGGIAFALGMLCLLLGTSLFKPSMNSMVGLLYPAGDRRRDAGFSIFYMGINIGSFLAPLVCGFLAQSERWKAILRSHGMRPEASWHWGFGAAAVGMAIGIIQYLASGHFLGQAGQAPLPSQPGEFERRKRIAQVVGGCAVAVLCGLTALQVRGLLHIDLVRLSKLLGYAVLLVPIIYIPLLFLRGNPSQTDRQRMSVIVILFFFMILFWAAEGQASSSVALFAKRYVQNSFLGFHFPSVWWLSISSLFVIALSPVLGWLWMRLGRFEPSSSTKFVMGLLLAGLGFLTLSGAALMAQKSGNLVSPAWLLGLFVFHTLGELCLGPVGLSMVTKLTPADKGSQMMGVWFLAVSMGSVVGGRFAGLFESLPLPKLFGAVVAVLWGGALILALLGKTTRRLMGSVS